MVMKVFCKPLRRFGMFGAVSRTVLFAIYPVLPSLDRMDQRSGFHRPSGLCHTGFGVCGSGQG